LVWAPGQRQGALFQLALSEVEPNLRRKQTPHLYARSSAAAAAPRLL
jgi:hypothetical protein